MSYQQRPDRDANSPNLARKIARDICTGDDAAGEDDTDFSSNSSGSELPYYNDTRNIEKWNEGDNPEAPQMEPTTNDPLGDKVHFSHKELRNSEAYKWLVSRAQLVMSMNGADSSEMHHHRRWLLDALKLNTPPQHMRISRNRSPALYKVRFDLHWNIAKFLQEQEYSTLNPTDILGRVITLTGNDQAVQALPCKEYMEQIWPATGVDLLRLLESVLQARGKTHKCKEYFVPFYWDRTQHHRRYI